MKLHQIDEQLEVSVSKLRSSTFNDVDMSACVFQNVNMSEWRIKEVNLRDAHISNADLSNLKIENVKLDGMTINGIVISDLLKLCEEAEAPWRD